MQGGDQARRGVHQGRSGDVGQHVMAQYGPPGVATGHGGLHVSAGQDRVRRGAQHPGGEGGGSQADRRDDGRVAAGEACGQDEDDQEGRERGQGIDAADHQVAQPAGHHGRQDTGGHPDGTGDRCSRERGEHDGPAAAEHPARHVPAEHVGAEEEVSVRLLEGRRELRGGAVRGGPRAQQGEQEHEQCAGADEQGQPVAWCAQSGGTVPPRRCQDGGHRPCLSRAPSARAPMSPSRSTASITATRVVAMPWTIGMSRAATASCSSRPMPG